MVNESVANVAMVLTGCLDHQGHPTCEVELLCHLSCGSGYFQDGLLKMIGVLMHC